MTSKETLWIVASCVSVVVGTIAVSPGDQLLSVGDDLLTAVVVGGMALIALGAPGLFHAGERYLDRDPYPSTGNEELSIRRRQNWVGFRLAVGGLFALLIYLDGHKFPLEDPVVLGIYAVLLCSSVAWVVLERGYGTMADATD